MQVSEILSLKGSTLFTVTPDKMLSECVVTMAEKVAAGYDIRPRRAPWCSPARSRSAVSAPTIVRRNFRAESVSGQRFAGP